MEAAELVAPWRDEIAQIIRASSSPEGADRALKEWAEERGGDTAIADLIYQSGLAVWMAGHLYVNDFEVPNAKRKLDVSAGWGGQFLALPFDEAIEYFLSKQVVDPETFYETLGDFRQRSFSATRLMTDHLRQVAYDGLVSALKGDGDFDSFAREILAGDPTLRRSYLRTVFDTNVTAAYGAGKLAQLSDPAVVEALPFRRYSAVMDPRTRPEHRDLDGKIWESGDTDWHRYMGGNGFNCRCTVIGIEADHPDVTDIALARQVAHPEPDFDAAPTVLLDLAEAAE